MSSVLGALLLNESVTKEVAAREGCRVHKAKSPGHLHIKQNDILGFFFFFFPPKAAPAGPFLCR